MAHTEQERPEIYGVIAEFETPTELVEAARRTRAAGYRHVDAFSPYPIEELNEALAIRWTRLPILIFLGGLIGGLSGYLLLYYTSAIDYPINVGGRPFNSWPSFVPITFEMTVLFAAFSAFLGMLGRNGLPRPYHPVFNVPRFELASRDRFFLLIEATDPKFDREETAGFLWGLNAREVFEVEP